MKVFIGFCILAVVFARQDRCPGHQTYNECGTSCPLTCDNYDTPPKVCGLVCVPGCHCDEGYVRTRDKTCVRKEECSPIKANPERETNEFCLAAIDPGICRAYFRKWYYNARTETCKMFVYGGCQGNRNRYDSEQDCLNRCKGVKIRRSKSNVCRLPAETGTCSSNFQRFYFDAYSGQCKMFIYSGCNGNGNNFKSLQECLGTCRK